MRMAFSLKYIKNASMALIVGLALSLPALPVAAAGETALVSVVASAATVDPGSQFTVDILIQPVSAIAGAQFHMSFNPDRVTINKVVEGNFFKQNGDNTYFSPGQIDNQAGTITGTSGTITTPGRSISAAGVFATITMTASAVEGSSAFTLSHVVLGDVEGQAVTCQAINGNISIGNGSNRAPVLNAIGDKSVSVNTPLNFIVSASDPDGDSLVYSAANLPEGALFQTSGSFSWTPTSAQIGTYSNLVFRVTDGILSDSETISVVVGAQSGGGGGGGSGGGGGGGGGGSATKPKTTPSPTPKPLAMTDQDGSFSKTVVIKSNENMAEVAIEQGTKGQTRDGKPLEQITITGQPPTEVQLQLKEVVGKVYDIEPDGATFNSPVKLTLTYDPALMPAGFDENNLVVATWDDSVGNWLAIPTVINIADRTLSAEISHFSCYAVFASMPPASLALSDLQTPVEVLTNQNIPEKVQLSDSGEQVGSLDVPLSLDDEIIITEAPAPSPVSEPVTTHAPAPNAKTVSLSLLAEFAGGGLLIIAATVLIVLMRRRRLLKGN